MEYASPSPSVMRSRAFWFFVVMSVNPPLRCDPSRVYGGAVMPAPARPAAVRPALAPWPPCTILDVNPPMRCSAMDMGARNPAAPRAWAVVSASCPRRRDNGRGRAERAARARGQEPAQRVVRMHGRGHAVRGFVARDHGFNNRAAGQVFALRQPPWQRVSPTCRGGCRRTAGRPAPRWLRPRYR